MKRKSKLGMQKDRDMCCLSSRNHPHMPLPAQMWDICLQLVDFAGSAVDATLVRQLWDHALLAAADRPESEWCDGV